MKNTPLMCSVNKEGHYPSKTANIISEKQARHRLHKMSEKGEIMELRFDPLGYLFVNAEDQDTAVDFAMYRNGTLYASINGIYHCAGKIDERERLVAALRGKKFIAERYDGAYDYSSKRVPLSNGYCLLVIFRCAGTINLLVADKSVGNTARIISHEENCNNHSLIMSAFICLLGQHNHRLAALASEWFCDVLKWHSKDDVDTDDGAENSCKGWRYFK